MSSVRLRRLLVCSALFVSLVPAAAAQGQAAHCEDDTTFEVMTGVVSAGAGPASCVTDITCPRAHRGPCNVESDVDISGIGLLAAEVVIGNGEPGTCSGSGGCTAAAEATLRPGKTARIDCAMTAPTAAASVTLTCSGAAT
ncbi:MAG TPA: hypothetical protein VHJ82_00865 [Actinomycetota bacterium]|nr:hypothetical protein [Actinomycetota bacterium]